MAFYRRWDKFPVEMDFRTPGGSFPRSFSVVISSKERVNPPSFKNLFRSCYEITGKDYCVFVSAGRFSVASESGSWLDLHVRAWASVRFFHFSDTASCAGSQPPRPSNASVHLSRQSSSCYSRNCKCPAGLINLL